MLCISPISIPRPNGKGSADRLTVPCGHCYACLTNRRSDWFVRINEEKKEHKFVKFITLTYDDNNKPNIGVVKADLQKFVKDVRTEGYKIRYYAVGEYGSKTKRPHYHIIVFTDSYISADLYCKLWAKGNITVFNVNDAIVMYITKYHVNKGDYPSNCNPSFTLMSLRPGIGSNYIKNRGKFHYNNLGGCYYPNYNKKLKLPRYFKDKIYTQSQKDEIAKKLSDEYDRKVQLKMEKDPMYFKRIHSAKLHQINTFKQKSNKNETI